MDQQRLDRKVAEMHASESDPAEGETSRQVEQRNEGVSVGLATDPGSGDIDCVACEQIEKDNAEDAR